MSQTTDVDEATRIPVAVAGVRVHGLCLTCEACFSGTVILMLDRGGRGDADLLDLIRSELTDWREYCAEKH